MFKRLLKKLFGNKTEVNIPVGTSVGVPSNPPASNTNPNPDIPTGGEPAKIKFINDIVIGLLVVLLIGFAGMFVAVATMFVTAWKEDKTVQQDLIYKIIEQNTKIDLLFQQQRTDSKHR